MSLKQFKRDTKFLKSCRNKNFEKELDRQKMLNSRETISVDFKDVARDSLYLENIGFKATPRKRIHHVANIQIFKKAAKIVCKLEKNYWVIKIKRSSGDCPPIVAIKVSKNSLDVINNNKKLHKYYSRSEIRQIKEQIPLELIVPISHFSPKQTI